MPILLRPGRLRTNAYDEDAYILRDVYVQDSYYTDPVEAPPEGGGDGIGGGYPWWRPWWVPFGEPGAKAEPGARVRAIGVWAVGGRLLVRRGGRPSPTPAPIPEREPALARVAPWGVDLVVRGGWTAVGRLRARAGRDWTKQTRRDEEAVLALALLGVL